jgi:hypothetical protein
MGLNWRFDVIRWSESVCEGGMWLIKLHSRADTGC